MPFPALEDSLQGIEWQGSLEQQRWGSWDGDQWEQGYRDGAAEIRESGIRSTRVSTAGVRAAGLGLGSHSLCPLYSVFANK